MKTNNLKKIRAIVSDFLGENTSQERMARLCGVRYETYKSWETRGLVSLNTLYAVKNAIQTICPEISEFDILRLEEADFPEWLAAELGRAGRRKLSQSERSLDELIGSGELWRALGGDAALSQRLRGLVGRYRADLDQNDWIAVITMLREGQEGSREWEFMPAESLTLRFKMPKGGRLTSAQRARIQRIVNEEIAKLQTEEKRKREKE